MVGEAIAEAKSAATAEEGVALANSSTADSRDMMGSLVFTGGKWHLRLVRIILHVDHRLMGFQKYTTDLLGRFHIHTVKPVFTGHVFTRLVASLGAKYISGCYLF
ncbi:unnamed protein product [Cuscuta europaea]|uniref:Uncharacterized protein n=1 Tax=Cuscuta europaea TaxID=41803 RepID=A0A9P0ZDN1_CUSEU|nr:unnamed protein product [Cuscuta europaea]